MKKTNKLISILLVLAMLLSMAPLTVLAAEATPTVEIGGKTYYELDSADDLDWFAAQVNGGNTTINATLTKDITYNSGTMSSSTTGARVWTPVGTYEMPFEGIINGNGYTISGLYSKDPEGSPNLAFVSYSVKATIANVALTNFYFESTHGLVAGLASYAAGSTIHNCYAQGSIYAKDAGAAAAGICAAVYGHSKTKILNCLSDVALKVDDPSDFTVSGISVKNYIGGIICTGDKNNPVLIQKTVYITDRYNGTVYDENNSLASHFEIYDSEGMPSSKLATGEIAYILGKGWGQKLGTDSIPEIGNSNIVNYGYISCDADAQKVYTNSATNPNYPEHYDSETDSDNACDFCGTNLHTHSFTYSASGDTITAVCANADGNCPDPEGTLTIHAPADLYVDGITAKEATIENNLVDTSVAISDITYSAPYGLPPKDAGTYTASVTVGGATATVKFTLIKYPAMVTDKDGNELSGSPYKTLADAITAASASEGSTITLLDDVNLTSMLEIASGKFILDLNGKTIINPDGIEIGSAAELTIVDSASGGKISGDMFGILNDGSLTVNGGVIKASCAVYNYRTVTVDGGNIQGYITNNGALIVNDGILTRIKNPNTSYTATVEINGGTFTDFNTIENNDGDITVKGGIYPNGFSVTNDGNLEYTANSILAEDYYYKDADGKLIDVADDAKIINGYVKVSKGADLADAVITLDSTEFTYNGIEIKPTVIVTVGGKTLTEGNDYNLTFANNVNAGTATVTVTGAGDYTGEAKKEFTIVKADNTDNAAPTPNTLTYNGEAHNLISAGEAMYGTMVYSLDGTEYSETIPQGTNAGYYTVYYKVIGDANHADTVAETVTVEIEKKAVTVSATVPDRIYGDDYHVDTSKVVVSFDGIVEGDDVGYVVTNAWYHAHTVTDNAPVHVVYNVNGADADNYQFPEFGENLAPNYGVQATGRVLPRDIANAEITLGDTLVYNGTEQTQTVTAVTVDGLEVTYTVSGNKATNVGVYELTITGNGNFAGETTALYEIVPDTTGIDALAVDNVKSSDEEAIEAVAQQIENAVTDLADDEKKAEYKAITDKCDKLLSKINDTANKIERIDETVNGYDKETVTSADVTELGKLIDDIKALTDGDNLTEDEKTALEETEKAIDELVEKLTEVAEEIKRVDEAVKSYDEETVKSTDSEDLAQLKEDIQNLIDSDNTTENEKTALEEMIKDIEGLEDKITETEEKLEEIKGIENNYNPENVSSDDKAEIEDKIAEIEKVNPDNLTDEQKAEYEEIKASLEALLEEIAAAEKDVADIGAQLEMLDEKRVTKFWEDDIEALKAKIDELLADENMGEAEKAKLNEYKAQAEKLTEIINTHKEYFSLRFFYLIWDCLTWKYNGILWLFSKIFG